MTQVQQATSTMHGGFLRLTSLLPQVSALVGGISMAAIVSESMQLADALDEMSERTGVSVEELAGLEYVAKLNGITLGDMGNVLRDLNKSISEVGSGNKQTTELFSRLGVSVKDADGRLRGAYDVLLDLADVFPRLSHADQVAVSLALLGKQGSALVPALNGGRAALEDLIREGQELNPITTELAKSVGEFNDNVDRAGMLIRSAAVPALQTIVPWINRMTVEMREGVRVFGGFSGAMMAMLGMNPFKTNTEHAVALREQIAGLEGDRARFEKAGADTRAIDEAIAHAQKKLDYVLSVQRALEGPQAGGGRGSMHPALVEPPRIALASNTADGEDKKAKAEAARAANELRRQQRDAYEDKVGQMRLELAQWRNNTEEQRRLAEQIAEQAKRMFGEQSKEYSAAKQELVRIDQRAAEQRKQIEDQLGEGQMQARLAVIEEERAQADQDLALGVMTMERRLALEAGFEERMMAVKRQALVAKLEMLAQDPDMNPVERARIQQQLEELERQHQARMGEIKHGQEGERARPGLGVMGGLEQQLEQAGNSLLTGQQSVMGALKQLWSGTYAAFVSEMITKPLAAWVAGQARMTLATIMGINTRTAAEVAGAATSKAVTGESVISVIAMKAYEAAASVYASIAAIPYVGPFLAPAMAAGALGVVMGMASNIFSAAGGFDIPAGVDPIVQAHAREMILPAKYADVIRTMAEGGGGFAGGGGDTWVIQAMDARSMQRFMRGAGGDQFMREVSLRKRSNRAG